MDGSFHIGQPCARKHGTYWDVAQMAEQAPVKRKVMGSIPIIPAIGTLAQLGEQLPLKHQAQGSTP